MATKTTELREMDPDDLEGRLADARQELFNLRFQHVTGQLDNYARLGDVRREIARVNTILREKEIEAAEATDEGTDEPETDASQEVISAARRARVLGSRRAAARAARQAAEEGREDA
ncbi:MAG: large subunit ribosomal protein [Actinomycetota bacterium]|nr:large subunit ribosomal protein [Actinomycetota bacterium]